jgi:RNA polymerase sigma-54 factor
MGSSRNFTPSSFRKLILTPSLQQAIKLLPMSTLELSDLLNQEMVENPMLEEVPTEDCSRPRRPRPRRPTRNSRPNKTDTWDDQDYEYFFGRLPGRTDIVPRAPQEV